jgi:ATP-binding cassette, subfamily B, bacterial HlyB/CyaB
VDNDLQNASGPAGDDPNGADPETEVFTPTELRLRAAAAAARFYGIDIDINDYRGAPGEPYPSPAALVNWLREQGLLAQAQVLKWKHLFRFRESSPVILLLKDGTAGLVVGAEPNRDVVWIKSPTASDAEPAVAVDRLRLEQAWNGEVVLVRRALQETEGQAPFTFWWITRQVLVEKHLIKLISYASMVLAVLAIVPAFIIMGMIDRVIEYNSLSTFWMLTWILVIFVFFETVLGWARRELVLVMSAKLDAKLNIHLFGRLLGLGLEFFERNQAGETISRLGNISRIRDFLTGRLLGVVLDSWVLLVIVPVLFYMQALLATVSMATAGVIALIVVVFLKPIGSLVGLVVRAEHKKMAVMTETVHGIRTVKTLALEPQQKRVWDERVADSTGWRLAAGRMSNWPQTLIDPLSLFMSRGVVVFGAYLALQNNTQVDKGALIGFMILSNRVAGPIVSFARIMEDFQEVRTAIGQVSKVLNNPPEVRNVSDGMRPRFEGRIAFEDLTFQYPMGSKPALTRVNFDIPPGTMLGLVGRSGSGKSTVTRLLQGINREYSGAVKIDGVEMREINLSYLRRSLGVVLQDNFLFRGTIKENIISGRAGLTLEDVVRAARLAGAEEFIERMPQGYDTWIEEGSTNISGGQRQRLAIARALITNPRIMILDEATSALDPESEALVNANLVRIGKGRTMVIVSHRLSSLVNCDLIMVLERGQMLDVAPHDVLVERCSTYRTLWNQQNRHIAAAQVATPALTQGE